MTKVMNFSENVEKNLVRLGHEVSAHLESGKANNLPERELVKESLRSLAQAEGPSVSPSGAVPPAPPVSGSGPEENFLPGYLSGNPDENMKKAVENLLQMTVSDGIVKAVNEARKYPPFVEDAFHDALTDKFLPELKKRGIIK